MCHADCRFASVGKPPNELESPQAERERGDMRVRLATLLLHAVVAYVPAMHMRTPAARLHADRVAQPFAAHGPAAARPLCHSRTGTASMCGLLAIVGSRMSSEALRLQTLTLQRLVRHRGPDGSGIHVVSMPGGSCSSIAHERLAIVDPLSGNQPLFSHDKTRSLAVNGEIYNHKDLRAEMVARNPEVDSWFRTESDCEVIVHLYDEFGEDTASKLDGDFAFVLLDETTGDIYAARDPIGVNSLYMGTGLDGAKWFASEAKPLVAAGCIDVETFPPGHYYSSKKGGLTECESAPPSRRAHMHLTLAVPGTPAHALASPFSFSLFSLFPLGSRPTSFPLSPPPLTHPSTYRSAPPIPAPSLRVPAPRACPAHRLQACVARCEGGDHPPRPSGDPSRLHESGRQAPDGGRAVRRGE